MRVGHLLLLCLLFVCNAFAQTDTGFVRRTIQMDSVVIKTVRAGWDVNKFIALVQHDTTFYKAFKMMRITPHTATNDIRIKDVDADVKASLYSHTIQNAENGCRTMTVKDEATTGKFYKRDGDYRYFTASLYAHLFFTKGKVCGENGIVGNSLNERASGKKGKYEWQLKQLVFNPGGKINGVPFIGNKASIFDPEIVVKYDFKLRAVNYLGEECYLFQAIPKPEYASSVVYNELSTWFRKTDYAILARDYSLSYDAGVYDFNVYMRVRLTKHNGILLPSHIQYFGNWHVLTQGRERADFTADFTY
jgi:hypothetical protein